MDELDQKPSFGGGGGAARGGGGFYHLSFRSGSRAGGASAHSVHDYVTRKDEYGGPDLDPAVYTESDHMPSWAEDDRAEYWEAADLYERANGRLYVSADFALPRELSAEDQVALAREFAHELTDEEHLPYTLAIHAGRDENGEEHNPHAHLMFSERQNDGIERFCTNRTHNAPVGLSLLHCGTAIVSETSLRQHTSCGRRPSGMDRRLLLGSVQSVC